MYWDINKGTEGGFDFSNYERNKSLNTNLKHKYKKTGTTIVGTIFKDVKDIAEAVKQKLA